VSDRLPPRIGRCHPSPGLVTADTDPANPSARGFHSRHGGRRPLRWLGHRL